MTPEDGAQKVVEVFKPSVIPAGTDLRPLIEVIREIRADAVTEVESRALSAEAFITIYEDECDKPPYGGHVKGCFSCCDVGCTFHDTLCAAYDKWDRSRKNRTETP